MEPTISPHDSGHDAERRAMFFDAGAKLGFDPDTLRVMFGEPGAATERVARPRIGLLSDGEWRMLSTHFASNILAAPGGSPRALLDALLWRVRHNFKGWRGVPLELGSADMLRQRAGRWQTSGALSDLFAALPGINLSDARRAEFEQLARQMQAAGKRAGE